MTHCYIYSPSGGKYKKIRHALHWAARNGRLAVADWLIHEKHIDVNIEADDGTVPMHFAVWMNNIPMVQWLVEVAHCDLHKLNSYGCNASQWGALNGDVAMLKMLQSYGLDLKLLNLNGHSAVHKAAVNGRLEACQWLLQTPQEVMGRVEVMEQVSKQDAVVDVDNVHTSLHQIGDNCGIGSSNSSSSSSNSSSSKDSNSSIISSGGLFCHLHMQADKSGNTPAMIARNNGHMETADWLESYAQQFCCVGTAGVARGTVESNLVTRTDLRPYSGGYAQHDDDDRSDSLD